MSVVWWGGGARRQREQERRVSQKRSEWTTLFSNWRLNSLLVLTAKRNIFFCTHRDFGCTFGKCESSSKYMKTSDEPVYKKKPTRISSKTQNLTRLEELLSFQRFRDGLLSSIIQNEALFISRRLTLWGFILWLSPFSQQNQAAQIDPEGWRHQNKSGTNSMVSFLHVIHLKSSNILLTGAL